MISADLGQQLEQFVSNLVTTGRYNSKSEVLREGVRLIQDRETRLAALDASIARGLADADAGRTTSADEAFDRLEAKYRSQHRAEETVTPTVEVYGEDEMKSLFEGEFAFLPRRGETISKEMGGYFEYYKVVEIRHREEAETGIFRACVRVEIDD